MNIRAVAVIVASIVVVVATPACTRSLDLPEGANGEVVGHVDGDTLDVAFEVDGRVVTERIRLIGIDTPETKKPGTPIECYGPEASARLAALLPIGSFVEAVGDREPRDDYGRLLAYVRRIDEPLFVNERLVQEGFARTLFFAPNRALEPRLRAAERSARDAGRGLWSACSGPDR